MPNYGLTPEERLLEVEKQLARVSERTHQQGNSNGRDQAIVDALRDLKAAQAAASAAPRQADLPPWAKWLAVIATILAIGGTIIGLIWSAASTNSTVTSNLAALNSWKIEQTTANLPARIQNLEAGFETARRIRDQQQQNASDRMRALELADQAGAERLNTVLQQLASITAQLQAQASRVEELLRRQDRLESRLGARSGAAPSMEQPSGLMVPLIWRAPF